jgi:twinkle protein
MKQFHDFNIDVSAISGQERTTCPQCSLDRKKSAERCLSVNTTDGTWFCHHCGWSGTLKEKRTEYKLPKYKKPSTLPENVIEWFEKRGIPEHILAQNGIGYGQSFKGKKGIQLPYYMGGTVVNVKHRSHDKNFRQEKDAEQCLYRFDAISATSGPLVITEGEIDALSVQTAGHDRVTSIPDGAPSKNTQNFTTKFDFLKSAEKVLADCEKVILAMDNDPPGKRAEQELIRRIGAENCWRVEYPIGCKDFNDVLVKHNPEKVQELLDDAHPVPVDGLFRVKDFEKEVYTLYEHGANRGLSTGWKTIDPYYMGLKG